MADGREEGAGLAALRERVAPWVDDLLRRSATLGFLGGMPVPAQIDHALGFVAAAEGSVGGVPVSVVDLGSGGGVPGVVLASCWPESRVVLLDSNERRTEFLAAELVGRVGRPKLEVIRGRAEEVGRIPEYRETFDLVTARSFGPPPVTAECGSPLLVAGGLMVVSEPPEADATERWPTTGMAMVGLSVGRAFRFGDRYSYQMAEKTSPVSDRYPRRTGIPTKRPLF